MATSVDGTVPTAERYRVFAEREARGLSACYEAWASGVAGDSATAALIDGLAPAKRQPNLVFSAARLLGAEAGSYEEFRDWLHAHWSDVRATAETHATQTNEAGRCALHLPVLAGLPGPIALLEVGASAGLCLFPDRYGYRYRREDGEVVEVEPTRASSVVLECEVRGDPPLPAAPPEVVWRAGIDLHPLDVASRDDLAWLDALVWPEHDDRRRRLKAAAAIAAADPPRIVAGDLNERLGALAAEAPSDATLVVFHTAVLMYLDEAGRARFEQQARALPGHWLSVEAAPVFPGIRTHDDAPHASSDVVLALDGEQLAWAQPHGRGIRWLPTP